MVSDNKLLQLNPLTGQSPEALRPVCQLTQQGGEDERHVLRADQDDARQGDVGETGFQQTSRH